jgi:hypothetical protein
MNTSLARLKRAFVGVREAERPSQSRALVVRPHSSIARFEPPIVPCAALDEYEATGRLTIEGVATGFSWQPGTQSARFEVQDFALNAAMGGSGQTNANLMLPYSVVARMFAQAANPLNPNVRLVLEVF